MSEQRRSDRIDVAIPIQVIGMELASGQTFCKQTETRVVSRHGAAIVLDAALTIDDEVTILCLPTNQEAKCRVVGVIERPGEARVYGIAFLDAGVNLWGIEFPELKESESGLLRVLLACGNCKSQEVAHLNEIEMQVLETNHRLQRACRKCGAITSWKASKGGNTAAVVEAVANASAELDGPAVQSTVPATVPATPQSGANRRKHGRVRTTVLGCVRYGGREETVTCEDVSRGGVSFRSATVYVKNAVVQIAVPCAKGAANIFVPGRIAHVRQFGNSYLVGVAYEVPPVRRNLADVV